MRRVNAEPHLLSVVPSGRPCLLIMCKLAGVHVTVLDQRPAHFPGAASTFRQASLQCEPVFSCTFNHSHRCLVIDDLLAMRRASGTGALGRTGPRGAT
jgi:hypothetical protein